jgi:hypothetical protein
MRVRFPPKPDIPTCDTTAGPMTVGGLHFGCARVFNTNKLARNHRSK